MKSIKSKIQISMLSVVLIGSVLIGVITALLNASGIDDVMTKTLGPATQMAADAVEWKMGSYWTALQEAAASDIFRESLPTAPELVPVRDDIAQRNGFLYVGKMDAAGFSSTGDSYADEEYFKQCKATMQPYISDIINDGSQMIFLLEAPILVNGRFEGAVYGGISADFLSDIVVNLAMGSDGVAYVLDDQGNVIGHPDHSIVEEGSNLIAAAQSDPSVADVAAVNQRMIQGETGFGSYNFYGDNKLVGFAPIEGYQRWSIAIEASQREFKSTLDRSILLTILVVVLVVLASFPIAVLVGRSISNPIQSCVARLEKLAAGDLQTPTPTVTSRDETAKLTRALETTVLRLNEVVQDVSHHLGRMAEGDFRETVSRTYVGDFAAMERSIRTIHNSLQNMLRQISQSGKALARRAGPGRLHGRVQGQDVGLEGDVLDGVNDLADLRGGAGDFLHGAVQILDVLHADPQLCAGLIDELARLLRRGGSLARGFRNAVGCGGELADGAGLLRGPLAQGHGPGGHLIRAVVHGLHSSRPTSWP